MLKITHKNKKGVIMLRVIRVKKLYNIKKQVQFLEGQVQELIEKNDFLIKDMQDWEAKNKQLFHEIVELRKAKSVLESENKRYKQHLLSAENALVEKDEKLKRYTEVMSGIKKLIFKYSKKKIQTGL
jgi:predicted nuclease with TOPRIM domain